MFSASGNRRKKMEAERRKKIRAVVKKLRAEMKKNPDTHQEVKKNRIRALAERGGLNLDEIIAAHDIQWCAGATNGCQQALTLS
jgi:hypothetical protein